MKGFTPLPVIMLMGGIILIYSAIKDVNPKTVVQNALQGKTTVAAGKEPLISQHSGFDPDAGSQWAGGRNGGGGSW